MYFVRGRYSPRRRRTSRDIPAARRQYLGELDRFRSWIVGCVAREELAQECIELLAALASDGARQAPNQREEEQALQPE